MPSTPRSRRILRRAAPLLLIGPLLQLSPDPAGAGQVRSCARAQLVDRRLRCDEELLACCPEGGGASGSERPGAIELEPGDMVTRAGCVRRRMRPDELAALGQVVDINRASADELASLPGIGPTLAQRILAGRPHAHVDALARVRGIGPATLARIRSRVQVRGGGGGSGCLDSGRASPRVRPS